MEKETERLGQIRCDPSDPVCVDAIRRNGHNIGSHLTLRDLLKRPHVHYDILHTHNLIPPDHVRPFSDAVF